MQILEAVKVASTLVGLEPTTSEYLHNDQLEVRRAIHCATEPYTHFLGSSLFRRSFGLRVSAIFFVTCSDNWLLVSGISKSSQTVRAYGQKGSTNSEEIPSACNGREGSSGWQYLISLRMGDYASILRTSGLRHHSVPRDAAKCPHMVLDIEVP